MSGPDLLMRDPTGFRHEPLRWAWALGAPYNVGHGFPVDLPVEPAVAERDFAEPLASADIHLRRDLGIHDRPSLVGALIRLGRAGHRRGHRALVRRLCALPAPAWAHYETADRQAAEAGDAGARERLWRMWAVDRDLDRCRTASFLGFDAARAAQFARSGYALGYLDEAELRGYLYDLAREVSATFVSWVDYAHDFLVGRSFWAGGPDDGSFTPALEALRDRPESPWVRLPFAFPEDEASRAIGSADAREGPYWTLEGAPARAPAPT